MIVDSYKQTVGFFPDVYSILSHLSSHDQVEYVVSASRTHTPKIAQKMLDLIHVEHQGKLVPSTELFDHKVWGIGTKIKHFNEIHKLTGVDYKDMIFFDDESRNRDVERQLGVTFVYIDEDVGMNWDVYENGLKLWRERQKKNKSN